LTCTGAAIVSPDPASAGDAGALGVERIVQDQRDRTAAEQRAGSRGDRLEHLGQRRAVRDRALDVEQGLEQALARAFDLQRGDAAEAEAEDACHAGEQAALVVAEVA
jgi:hypothetical protein